MAISTVKVTAEKLEKKKKRLKYTKYAVSILFILLLSLFFVLLVIYKGGNFTVTLDPNFALKNSITLYETLDEKTPRNKLYATEIPFMDNITESWLPQDIDTSKEGTHNGDNYIAYTFYIANEGKEITNYWYQINILDVIKNVDDAVRIKVYENGIPTLYAKASSETGKAEPNTVPFKAKNVAVLKERKEMKPGDIDRYTVVIYLEGEDPECVDAIIGGEIKLNMEFREEHKDNGK